MKTKLWLALACLLSQPIYTTTYHFEAGPTFEYTRYRQDCLPHQSGMMVGPYAALDLELPYCIDAHVAFKGLFDIPYICSKNGVRVDAREYEVNGHFGYTYNNEECGFSITPFTGIDFIYLRHTIENCIIRNRYFQVNVPVGFDFNYQCNSCLDCGFKFYYDIDAWTRLKVSTPNLIDTSEQKIELERSHRIHLEAPLTWNFTGYCGNCYTLSWTPLFTWQKFGKEKCPTNLNIPVLKQWHIGSTISFGITF